MAYTNILNCTIFIMHIIIVCALNIIDAYMKIVPVKFLAYNFIAEYLFIYTSLASTLFIVTAKSVNGSSEMIVWVKNHNDTMTVLVDLDFDPSQEWHSYVMAINEEQPDAQEVSAFLRYFHIDKYIVFVKYCVKSFYIDYKFITMGCKACHHSYPSFIG